MKHLVVLLIAAFVGACADQQPQQEISLATEDTQRREPVSAGTLSFQQKFDKDILGPDAKHLFRVPPVVPVGGIFALDGNCLFPFSAEEIADPASPKFCGKRANIDECIRDNFCVWNRSCTDLSDQDSCETRNDCFFGPDGKCAQAKCADIKQSQKCDRRYDCQWSQNSCQFVSCNAIKEPSLCQNRPDCSVSVDAAKNIKCSNNPSYKEPDLSKTECRAPVDVFYQCPRQDHCVDQLAPVSSAKPNPYQTCYACAPLQSACEGINCPCKDIPEDKKCTQFSSGAICRLVQQQCHQIEKQTDCTKGFFCEWVSGAKPFCQARSDAQAATGSFPLNICHWVPEKPKEFDPACESRTGKCFRANLLAGKSKCLETDGFCQWNESNNGCELSVCPKNPTTDAQTKVCAQHEQACNEIGLCQWDGANKRCEPKPLHRASSDLESCEWDGSQMTPRETQKEEVVAFLNLIDGFANGFRKADIRCSLIGSGGPADCAQAKFSCNASTAKECELGVQIGCVWENNKCVQSATGCEWDNNRCRAKLLLDKRAERLNRIRSTLYNGMMDVSARDCRGFTKEGVVTIGTFCPRIVPCGQAMFAMRELSCRQYDGEEESCEQAKNALDKPLCEYNTAKEQCVPHQKTAKEICEKFKDASDDAVALCVFSPNAGDWADNYESACKPTEIAKTRCLADPKKCRMNKNETQCLATDAAISECQQHTGCDYNSSSGECINVVSQYVSQLNQLLDYVPVGLGFWCHANPVSTANSKDETTWPDLPFCPANTCRYEDNQAMRCGVCTSGKGDENGWCT